MQRAYVRLHEEQPEERGVNEGNHHEQLHGVDVDKIFVEVDDECDEGISEIR